MCTVICSVALVGTSGGSGHIAALRQNNAFEDVLPKCVHVKSDRNPDIPCCLRSGRADSNKNRKKQECRRELHA